MNPLQRIEEQLRALGREPRRDSNGSTGRARCPVASHGKGEGDRNPSMTYGLSANGFGWVKCHAGCTSLAILAELSLAEDDLRPARPAERREVEAYPYMDESGALLFQVVRYEPKDFLQRRPDGRGGWIWNLDGVQRVLYRLPDVLAAAKAGKTIYVVEGEKDVHAAEGAGALATTNPGGAGKWRSEYNQSLRGAHVIIVADGDEVGRRHARQVAAELNGIAASVRIVEAAVGKDLHDHLAAGKRLDELVACTANPTPLGETAIPAPAGLRWNTAKELVAATAGDPDWIVAPYIAVGAVTDLAAKVKLGKTRLALAAVAAQLTGLPFLGKPTRRTATVYLTEESVGTFRQALARTGLLDSVDLHVLLRHDARTCAWPDIVAAAVAKCREVGAQLLIVDTLADWANLRGDDENAAGSALEAMQPLREAAATGLAVVMLRHDRKSGGGVGDSARGSSAFTGSADVLLSLKPADGRERTNRRVLEGVGRFDGIPSCLTIELRDQHYVALGEGRSAVVRELADRIKPMLPSDGSVLLAHEIAERLGRDVSKASVGRALRLLEQQGEACIVPKQGRTKQANGYAAK